MNRYQVEVDVGGYSESRFEIEATDDGAAIRLATQLTGLGGYTPLMAPFRILVYRVAEAPAVVPARVLVQ